MTRMVLLTCAMQVFCLGYSYAQTRDQVIVLAMLGQVPGDKAEPAGLNKVLTSKRVDDQTIHVEIKAGSDRKTIKIKEDPKCVFSIGSNETYYAKIDFSSKPKISTNDTLIWLEGRNVSCSYIQGACFDYTPLSFLGVPEEINQKQLDAARTLKRRYCDPVS